MTALPLDAARYSARAMPEPIAPPSSGDPRRTATERPSCTLDLSRSRAHDAVLDILKAYKLTGNFHNNLEVVLRDMGVFDMVTYRIEPHPALAFPDCRHVVFTLNDNALGERFDDIIKSVKAKIGFEAPWWGRMLRRLQPGAAGAAPMCRTYY